MKRGIFFTILTVFLIGHTSMAQGLDTSKIQYVIVSKTLNTDGSINLSCFFNIYGHPYYGQVNNAPASQLSDIYNNCLNRGLTLYRQITDSVNGQSLFSTLIIPSDTILVK